MSALPSPLQNQHGSNESAADPSMEEILASIRRIIADDHGTPITPRPPRASLPPALDIGTRPPRSPRGAAQPSASARAPETAPVSRDPVLRDPGLREPAAHIDVSPPRMRPVPRASENVAFGRDELERAPEPFRVARSHPAPEPASPVAAPPANAIETLLSPLAQASVTSAFEALTVSMAAQNTSMVEDAVRDMLRPMLKQWLDDNLPTIVERLVRAEIERVARGGRS